MTPVDTTSDVDATRGSVMAPSMASAMVTVSQGRRRRASRRRVVIALLVVGVLVMWAVGLTVGRTIYSPADVVRVIMGQEVAGASFTVGRLRLPRTTLAVVSGLSFGLSGVTFQTLLRNPLASPDIIGISAGASTAAAFAIVVLGLSGTSVSVFAIVAGLGVALAIYLLASRDGVVGTRLILIGIGVAAMLESATAWIVLQAAAWDYQEVLRWLTGSLNGTTWPEVAPTIGALVVLAPILLGRGRDLGAMQLGDDGASALGVQVERTRLVVVIAAVGLVAFAVAGAGPIAFVAFLCGPIAARVAGPHGSLLVPSALVGALLVLTADFAGQYLLGTRFPVGVVTGVLGAPYLVYLIVRTNRVGRSL